MIHGTWWKNVGELEVMIANERSNRNKRKEKYIQKGKQLSA